MCLRNYRFSSNSLLWKVSTPGDDQTQCCDARKHQRCRLRDGGSRDLHVALRADIGDPHIRPDRLKAVLNMPPWIIDRGEADAKRPGPSGIVTETFDE